MLYKREKPAAPVFPCNNFVKKNSCDCGIGFFAMGRLGLPGLGHVGFITRRSWVRFPPVPPAQGIKKETPIRESLGTTSGIPATFHQVTFLPAGRRALPTLFYHFIQSYAKEIYRRSLSFSRLSFKNFFANRRTATDYHYGNRRV